MSNTPLLRLDQVHKTYNQGVFNKRITFDLQADFSIQKPAIVGIMGPNGSGKTTLFELITGSNNPSSGQVLCCGQDIHQVRSDQRDRLAIHYHQSYQVRHFRKRRPNFMLQPSQSDYPMVHLFDEPQFNTQDGYIGFMLDFFRRLRSEGRLVFLCVHPNEPFHLQIMREICEQYIFVQKGRLTQAPNFDSLLQNPDVTAYLGELVDGQAA
ncbi:MAG: ATP-binding cassette domain-containing protein [Alphaproteobacteria bacterium]|nr:ATP-binding cassette domain-containing protein [Alphaproteobacteria bacterium]